MKMDLLVKRFGVQVMDLSDPEFWIEGDVGG